MKLIFVHFQNHNKIYIYFLIIIFFFSFVLRIIHLNWGLPDIEEEAFPMKKAFEMWDWDNGKINLDPETAGWPSLSFYINFLLQLFHYAIGHLFGEFENRYDYFVAFKLDPTQVTLISRGLSLFSSIIIIYIGFKLAFEISGILPGLFVGLILSSLLS
jgi:hypothetical protein